MTVEPGPAVLWLGLGVVLAIPYILAGRRLGDGGTRWWMLGLIVAALVYVGFAVARSAPPMAIAFEAGGVFLYGAIAANGLRGDVRWIGAAWLLHPVWDIGLHHPGGFAYAPTEYVLLCSTFDVVVGVYLLLGSMGAVLEDTRS
ncbi:DUF6010 family protein [Rubrivirga sp.]|uniref:DUF6010 family protein n=1 Tax=Rubrivirga sp. TaxID=1885344 RepID=UPI003C718B98